jgi:excinuclease ABC subunit A
LKGAELIDDVVLVDQSQIGRTTRSNPASYVGAFDCIRDLFAAEPASQERRYTAGTFSFNSGNGRCPTCGGNGFEHVEMQFLSDVYLRCPDCNGKRYRDEVLEIKREGANKRRASIADVLEMTVEDALEFFKSVPIIRRKLETLIDVGLSYITLGQNALTLSGGEAQRVKLSRELSKRDTGNTLYILDEPTTGLHFHDVEQLLKVLHRLRDHGNTIVVIEHNLDVIKTADWLVDMGPEGGHRGGEIVAVGTPENVAAVDASYTGQYLRKMLKLVAVPRKAHRKA